MEINTILDQIDLGEMALPAFQRGYVWNRDQVRAMMKSLYKRYSISSLLVWVTKTESNLLSVKASTQSNLFWPDRHKSITFLIGGLRNSNYHRYAKIGRTTF